MDKNLSYQHVHDNYLSWEARARHSTDDIFSYLLEIINEVNDPALGFAIVTNLCYRLRENAERSTGDMDLMATFDRFISLLADGHKEATPSSEVLVRWGLSAAATLSSYLLIDDKPEEAQAVILSYLRHGVETIQWCGVFPMHLNHCSLNFNYAIIQYRNGNKAESALFLDKVCSLARNAYVELSSPLNRSRLHHIFDLRNIHAIHMPAIGLYYLALDKGRRQAYSFKKLDTRVHPQLIYPRLNLNGGFTNGFFTALNQKIDADIQQSGN